MGRGRGGGGGQQVPCVAVHGLGGWLVKCLFALPLLPL